MWLKHQIWSKICQLTWKSNKSTNFWSILSVLGHNWPFLIKFDFHNNEIVFSNSPIGNLGLVLSIEFLKKFLGIWIKFSDFCKSFPTKIPWKKFFEFCPGCTKICQKIFHIFYGKLEDKNSEDFFREFIVRTKPWQWNLIGFLIQNQFDSDYVDWKRQKTHSI